MREAVEELREQMQRHLFENFIEDCVLRAGSGIEAVEELREQIQRHLFETFVNVCVACREW